MTKRIFDIVFAFLCILLFSPLLLTVWVLVLIESRGKPMYLSMRNGKHEKLFKLYKFKSMKEGSDYNSITIGHKDPRVTRLGYVLRKYKLDELPQLFNVLMGDLSFVGPRADLAKYAPVYKEHFPEYFELKPGLTGMSSLALFSESEMYNDLDSPELYYIHYTIPLKSKYARIYQQKIGLRTDLILIFRTIGEVIKNICIDGKNLVIQPSHVEQRDQLRQGSL